MKLVAAAILVLLGATYPASAESASPEMAQLAGRQLAIASHAVLEGFLRDYRSARFRRVYPHIYEAEPGKQFWYLCGELNAKGALGGYAGWEPFLITPEAENRIAIWSGTDGPGDAAMNVEEQIRLCLREDLGGAKNTAYKGHDFGAELSYSSKATLE